MILISNRKNLTKYNRIKIQLNRVDKVNDLVFKLISTPCARIFLKKWTICINNYRVNQLNYFFFNETFYQD